MRITGGNILKKRLVLTMRDVHEIVTSLLLGQDVTIVCGDTRTGMDVSFLCGTDKCAERKIEPEGDT
jgi:hypothetical protein